MVYYKKCIQKKIFIHFLRWFIWRQFIHKQIISLYRDLAVAMVTPLRDGVSIVAKGVRGMPNQGSRGSYFVAIRWVGYGNEGGNCRQPYDIEKTTRALQKALTMPLEEKKQRMAMLRQRESSQNIFIWTELFLPTLISLSRLWK